MILDTIYNETGLEFYINMHKRFEKAFTYLKELTNCPATGRYSIDGDAVFALVQEYDTVPENQNKWESHRKYIDIQFIFSGKESMGWADLNAYYNGAQYDETADVILEQEIKDGAFCTLTDRQFAVFFPEDIHKPQCMSGDYPTHVKKIVVNVAI